MRLGQIEKYKGQGLVAFLDILGFAKEIESKWKEKTDNPLDRILKIKDEISIFLATENKPTTNSLSFRRYECRVQTISDSFIVSFGFEENPHPADFILAAITFLDIIAVIWRKILENGFTIRGAIDFGDIYWNEKEIIGPAFINSFKLELNYAKTSRVIISSNFNKFLVDKYFQVKTLWNEDILSQLRKDIDGYLILNPHALYLDDKDKKHVIGLLNNLQGLSTGSQKEKYAPLLACLNQDKGILESKDLGLY